MELKHDYDILIPGKYFCDIIFTGLPGFPKLGTEIYSKQVNIVPGGGALISVIALRRLGVNVGWISRFGTDFFSQYIQHFLETERVDMSLVVQLPEPMQRVTVSLSYPEDRAFITYVDPSPSNVDLALEALEKANFRHLHFTSLVVDDRVPGLLDACHARGITVSMDCQHRDDTLSMPLVREILSRVDIFMPNAIEALRITQTDTIDDAVKVLNALVPLTVVKRGDKGALAARGDVLCHSPALPSTVVDTTGAGDVFNAGFVAAFVRGKELTECLQWGNFCGGMSVRGLGGLSTAPSAEQLEAWLLEQQ